ncbi:MAG TPA: helix-turn-helix domain-containing protein, partial [Spirochaetota bacterium]|nr:helix-turn-helix domain-containing protein [Spirochaetota bacterium]
MLDIGFSENEAKAYLSLLEEYPVTAYETAKKSNIPTSKIYGVLSKLLSKGIILEVNENQKKKYIPKEPEKFIEGYRSKMDNLLFDLKDDLNNITKKAGLSFISNISDYKYFMKKACD